MCMVLMLASCGSGTSKEASQPINYELADKEEGQRLLLSNTVFFDGFTDNDLQFRLQDKNASMEEYLSFAANQVLDFSDEQKAFISEYMERIDKIIAENGYHLPPLDKISFILTTMREECDMTAYTHGTQIYLSESYLNSCIEKNEYDSRTVYVLAHEIFHCLTRCNPDFRAEMYKLINFTVQDEEYTLPPSVLEFFISNPDVEHHNAYAAFDINGETVDCFLAFITTQHFEKKGDMFFDVGTAVLVPVDGEDKYYLPEDAANFDEVFGLNTDYTIDPEECMATNFGYLIAYGDEGPLGEGYKTPEIIEGIKEYLKKD